MRRWPGQTFICRGPFGGGGSSTSSTSSSSNQTNVQVATTSNVTVPVNLAVNTTDLADAINALAGAQTQAAELNLLGQVTAGQAQATGTVQAAQINAGSGPSLTTIILVVVALLGLGFTAGFIKLPKGLKA